MMDASSQCPGQRPKGEETDMSLWRRTNGKQIVSLHCSKAVFSFLYFLKIKISKIYVRFEIFQKYPPVAPHRATGPKCNFYFFKFATRSLEKKGAGRPPNGRQGPVAPGVGDRPLFFQGPRCKFKEKKLHLEPVALWEGDRGYF